jgi:hypothetical protein
LSVVTWDRLRRGPLMKVTCSRCSSGTIFSDGKRVLHGNKACNRRMRNQGSRRSAKLATVRSLRRTDRTMRDALMMAHPIISPSLVKGDGSRAGGRAWRKASCVSGMLGDKPRPSTRLQHTEPA